MHKLMTVCLMASLVCSVAIFAMEDRTSPDTLQLPPLETFVMEPISLENVSIWVPAGKSGPMINRSCRAQEDRPYSCVLPAGVEHTKTDTCPDGAARLLADYTACYHEQSLPLTIFNGWRWEYSYSLSQFESGTYDLPDRGGCWENSWEAVLTESVGSGGFEWLRISSSGAVAAKERAAGETSIHVKTFDSMRTRDGYPKERKLK